MGIEAALGTLIVGAFASGTGATGVAGFALTSTTIFGFSLVNIVGATVIVGTTLAISYAMAPKPPRPDDGQQTKKLGVSPRVGGYGRARVSGQYMFYEVAPGDDRSVDIIALLSGKLSNFKAFYLHDDKVSVDAGTGNVAAMADGRYGGNTVHIDTRQGLASQTAFAQANALLPLLWTSAHQLNGIAALELTCRSVGTSDFTKVYPQGLPEPSVVADLYELWDPRDLAQSPTNPATWTAYAAWSNATAYTVGQRVLYAGVVYIATAAGSAHIPDESPGFWASVWGNPVLQIIDYLTNTDHGMGLNRAQLIDPVLAQLRTEASRCDELVTKKDGTKEPRYTCGGIYEFTNAPDGILTQPLAACDGWMAENGDGTLALVVGVYRAPTITLDIKHVLGFAINYGVADEEVINELPITYTSPDFLYRDTPAQPWRDDASISLVGRVRSRDLPLPWVNSFSQARRLAKRTAYRANARMRGSVTTDLSGLAALGERWVTLNYPVISGLTNAVVEIQSAKVEFENGRCSFDWVLIDPATVDAWNPATEEGTAPPLPADTDPAVIPVPANVTILNTASGVYYYQFDQIEDPTQPTRYTYLLNYRLIDDGTGNPGLWSSARILNATTAAGRTSFLIPLPVGDEAQFFEVQTAAVGPKGTVGAFAPSVAIGIEAETVALRTRMTVKPTPARLQLYDNLIKGLKTSGAWAKMDALYVLAVHDAQTARLNWKKAAFDLTLVAAPTFTVDRGYSAFTGTAYLQTGFDPTAVATKVMDVNNTHYAVYVRDNTLSVGGDIGVAAASFCGIFARYTGDVLWGAVNFASPEASLATGITDARGLSLLSRTSSTTVSVYKNGVNIANPAQASSILPTTRTIILGGRAQAGSPTTSGRALGCGSFGAGMTTPEALGYYNALQTYMTAVGANV